MKCMEFENLLSCYFEEDIDYSVKEAMDNHIKDCDSCREKLNKRKKMIATFKYVFEDEDIEFKSRREEIIKNINNSKYTGSLGNKIFYSLRNHKNAWSGTVAAVFLMFIVIKFGGNFYDTIMHYSEKVKENNKINNAVGVEKINKGKKPSNDKADINISEDIAYVVLPRQQLNPTGDGMSNIVSSQYRKKLDDTLKNMRGLSTGVGPWRIIYCNNDKLMFYNYNHLIAYNYNEKNKGIYSILDFSKLKVGSYQGSEIIDFSFSPDGNYCLIGTSTMEIDIKGTKSLYIYNINDGTIKEIVTNFNMKKDNIIWYSLSSRWVVSAKDDGKTIIWDVNNFKALKTLPMDIKKVKDNAGRFLNFDNLKFKKNNGNISNINTGKIVDKWWFKDENTLIGVPYRTDIQGVKLSDFEIVEINIVDRTGKIVFRP